MTIEDDILKLLEDNGHGVINDSLFVNYLPNEVDEAIVIFSYASPPQTAATDDFEYNFQCRVRKNSDDYDAARAEAFAIHAMFNRTGVDTVGRRIVFRPANPPNFLYYDDSNRPNFVFNFTVITTGN